MKAISFEYIEVFYNRNDSTLGYQSPTRCLENWLADQQREKQVG